MNTLPLPVKSYFDSVHQIFDNDPKILSVITRKERIGQLDGFINVEIKFLHGYHGSFFEFYNIQRGVTSYRYQIMDHNMDVIRRWDNALHHKELSTFPQHLHLESSVIETTQPTIQVVLNWITEMISNLDEK